MVSARFVGRDGAAEAMVTACAGREVLLLSDEKDAASSGTVAGVGSGSVADRRPSQRAVGSL